MSVRAGRVQVFAVLRLDRYQVTLDASEQVVVQAVLPTLDEAKAEVDRLNAMVDPDHTTYFWRATRYYPDGRAGKGEGGAPPPS